MLPSALVAQLQQGMRDFLKASFSSSSPGFDTMLDRFLAGADAGPPGQPAPDAKAGAASPIFRGPFLSLKLPFEHATSAREPFPEVPLGFAPYRHQAAAFARLGGPQRHNTLVATGTGSGKTETFLYPILAHCARAQGREGVKALLIYPMNALANDQAARFARAIHAHEGLRGRVSAGLYIGQSDQVAHAGMGESHIITDKDQLKRTPPDILLTNYKMLDYLLARPRDQALWRHNDPETLQFLVVDELHTFDGAQGTDLGCLLRRLKARLGTPPGHLTCVGTSATLGGGGGAGEGAGRLIAFAEAVFAEPFGADAIIRESRQSSAAFTNELTSTHGAPGAEHLDDMDPSRFQSVEAYLARQQQLWFGAEHDPVALGEALRRHRVFQNLVRMVGNATMALDEVVGRMLRVEARGADDAPLARAQVLSLLAMVSHARRRVSRGDAHVEQPLVQVRVELWQREMGRMVATVGPRPALRFHDDLTRDQQKLHLPVVYCQACGLMGWGTMRDKDRRADASVNLKEFYRAFFARDPRVDYLFRAEDAADFAVAALEHDLDTGTLMLSAGGLDPAHVAGELLRVATPANETPQEHGTRLNRHCPRCSARGGLSLLGSRAATLTSTFINQLFASGFNDDKKLLTFSDSVQDASHRAGFFGARTWRFNLRVAVQRALEAAGGAVALDALPDAVVAHWRARMSDAEFVATFIAPDMRWLHGYEALLEHGELPAGSDLFELIGRRIAWEVFAEYGYMASRARSLPRTGASAVCMRHDRVDAACAALLPRLQNEVGGLRQLAPDRLRRFVLGLLHHLLGRGAIFAPELASSYLSSGGKNTWQLGAQRPHMPNFGPASRLPAFLASRATRRFDTLTLATRSSWFEAWLETHFSHENTLVLSQAAWIYELVLAALVDADLLDKRTFGDTHVWGLQAGAAIAHADVVPMRDSHTGELRWVAAAELDDWFEMPGLARGSQGVLRPAPDAHDDPLYYAKLYRHGDVRRIVAAEHTGLLERAAREALEDDFKRDDPQPWFPNLLSCTPTLEMGIDVGSLSTAILCSVPPSQANYLQRIGRAGRRDGNALILTLAEARAHDLYFFAAPHEMIAGDPATPGVFLNASAVLERQLTAFCMDRWAKVVSPEDLPTRLGDVLRNIDNPASGRFPHNLLSFLRPQKAAILDDFLALFDDMGPAARDHLRRFMLGDEHTESLELRILAGLQREARDVEAHRKDLERVRARLKKLDAREVLGDTEAAEQAALEVEKDALQRLIARRRARHTLEFFTSEGLLPNYAFPEAGVNLRSLIWRRRAGEGRGGYDKVYYEYERPARQALKELAPGSHFYAGGRRVTIDRVDVDDADVEFWQFCDNCHFWEADVGKGSDYKTCPACGSANFGDLDGQRRQMLRLRQVYAGDSDRRSRIGDERDERLSSFYNRSMLVRFDKAFTTESWSAADASLAFGYEYAQRTNFLDINCGNLADQGDKVTIAGTESVRPGFRVCAACGKLQPPRTAGPKPAAEPAHTWACPERDKDDPDILECLFLYRQFASESLRILLPFVDQPGYKERLHSFIAAVQMGLQAYFAGQVDHLETTVFEEPSPDGARRKQFLVLYDTVPGGTGYLKELMRADDGAQPLFRVFERAFALLKSCPVCTNNAAKDGCYRCLYAYRNSYDLDETSRQAAVEILGELLEVEHELEPCEWLGDINPTGLFDSALEARLIEALRRHERATLKRDMVGGRPGFRLSWSAGQGDADGPPRVKWELAQQQLRAARLGGLQVRAEVDLLATFARQDSAARPIAIFTDGFQYHDDRVGLDLIQRMALVRSGAHWAWSLTWHDVEDRFSPQSDFFKPCLGDENAFYHNIYSNWGGEHGWRAHKESSLAWLERLLAAPPARALTQWRAWAAANAASFLDPHSLNAADISSLRDPLREVAPEAVAEVMLADIEPGHALWGVFEPSKHTTPLRVFVAMPLRAMTPDADDIRVMIWLDDRPATRQHGNFRFTWNTALRLYNLFQFLPKTFAVAASVTDDPRWDALALPAGAGPVGDDLPHPWVAAREEVLDDYRPLVDALWAAGVRAEPAVGHELLDDRGRVTDGFGELAWPARQIAVVELDPDDPITLSGRQAYLDQGWTVFDGAAVLAHPEPLIDALEDHP